VASLDAGSARDAKTVKGFEMQNETLLEKVLISLAMIAVLLIAFFIH
jgi:hypothetical protein